MSGREAACDAVVVGSGPNGLAAAITLARAGHRVCVLEAESEPGGATRSAPLVGPGYVNDLGSAIHPLAKASPFLSTLGLGGHGLEWVTPPAAVGHPLDGARAVVAWNELERTADALGADGRSYRRLVAPLVDEFDALLDLTLTPLTRLPRQPLLAARFGLLGALPVDLLMRRVFDHDVSRALFAGHAAHAVRPLTSAFTSAFGLLFAASTHAVGWPFPRGGASAISRAMVSLLESFGGEVHTGVRVRRLGDIPPARVVVFDLTPRQILEITGTHFRSSYRNSLARFRYGAAVFKLDYALSGPVPWASPDLGATACVHVAGSADDVIASEASVHAGRHPERPFLIFAQHSLFDDSRAPDGCHTAWVYCHVPNGSTVDMTDRVEAQIERFAPGFRDVVLERRAMNTVTMEGWNSNLVGGDINGGSMRGRQLVARPAARISPATTPDPSMFIGSASAWPGGGVHGMAGHHAGLAALRTLGRA